MTVPQPLVVIGAGGFGREALDVVEAMNAVDPHPRFDLRGVADDAPSAVNTTRLAQRGVSCLGPVDEVVAQLPAGSALVIAIGSPAVRARLEQRLRDAGMDRPALVHPRAGIGSRAQIGVGSVICAGVEISTNVALGRSVHLNPSVTIGHDAILDDYVSVNPGAIVSGDCVIEPGVLLGAGSVVLQGIRVGRGSTVGAAACVVRHVAPGITVTGVPAKNHPSGIDNGEASQ